MARRDVTPDEGAETRTWLAVERTMLAWWRTGLAAVAVSLGIGRVLPELDPDAPRWPFVALGLAFCLYGIALFASGTARGLPAGSRAPATTMALAAVGVVLGIATAVLITLD